MKQIAFVTLLLLIIGCSTKQNSYMQNSEVEYQRFLNEKNLKELKKELENYHEK
jgi:hypothetical protein